MSLLGSVFDTVDDVVGGLVGSLGGDQSDNDRVLGGSLGGLIDNVTGGLNPTDGSDDLFTVLDLDLLGNSGLVQLDLLGGDVIVLPNNGGLIEADLSGLLGDDGPSQTGLLGILDIGGLIGEGGLLDLNGLLGGGSVLDLTGLLGEILEILSPGGALDPDDYLDPDEEIDPDAFDNVFIGTPARDAFLVPETSTYIDGLGELDTATFTRSAEDLSFAVGENAVLFSDGDALFYFQNVERVAFFEGRLLLDTGAGETAGVAYRIYQAAFDRTPDNDGLAYWVDRLDAGLDWKGLAQGFVFSQEFAMTYGTSLSNEEYVDQLYENVLGRTSEGAGRSYWTDQLDSGARDRADVLIGFSESNENIVTVGQTIDSGYTLT